MAKSTSYGDYKISIEKDGSVIVMIKDEIAINTKDALRKIADECDFVYDKSWNTRLLGKKVVDCIAQNPKFEIIEILSLIAKNIKEESVTNDFSYNQQRAMINRIFQIESYDICSIMLRLTVIDSLYSTNASYTYFSIEEMAKAICGLGDEEQAKEYFVSLLSSNDADSKFLFNNEYGIRKNLKAGSGRKQPSLMSKYAYYQLLQSPEKYPLGFPIYDSLAIKMYPKVCEVLRIKSKSKSSFIISATSSNPNICDYIQALDELRQTIFNNDDSLFEGLQQFDILDAYLWRMGKINEGNFSLLLNRFEYEQLINNLGLNSDSNPPESNNFNASVRDRCVRSDTQKITQGLPDVISKLIEHWKTFYVNEEDCDDEE